MLFLGTGAHGADSLRFTPHPNITVRQISFCEAGWRQKFHYIWFYSWAFMWVLKWRPRWIYASDPFSCPLGLLLSRITRCKVIYHEHDTPDTSHSARGMKSPFVRFIFWTRKVLARHAVMCVLPNEERVKRFSSEMGGLKHVYCVWNCPVLKEVNLKQRSDEKGSLMVLYHGSIVPFRLPLAILQALKMLPREVKLRVIGYETVGSVGYVTQMKELASRLQISDRIEFIGPMPRHKLMEFSKTCEVGLALMPKQAKDLNIECMLGASNKPFDYLACGLALLVSDLPDWEKIYVEPGYGLACDPDDPESVATALKWFLDHPQEMRAMGEKGRNRIISEWNYEKQFLLVLGCMEKSTVF